MKILACLILLISFSFDISRADSPVGNCELYKYGIENPLIKKALDEGVLSDEMIAFIDDEKVDLTQKIFLLNAVVQKYPTILNTALLAKHWGIKYVDIFNGDRSLPEWKNFLLALSALFEETLSPDNHLKVLKDIGGDFVNRLEYKAMIAMAEAQVDVVENKDQCEVFPAFKKRIENIGGLGLLGQALIKEIDAYMESCKKTALMDDVGYFVDLVMGVSQAHADELIQPRWVRGGNIDSPTIQKEMNIDVDMSKSGGQLELTCEKPSNKEEKVTVKTCNEYYELLNKECYAYSTYDITMQGWFIDFCDSRKGLLKVEPSKMSYVRDLINMPVDQIVKRFDLMEYLAISGDESEAFKIAKQKGLDWTDLAYDFEVRKTDDGIEIESKSQDFLLHFDFISFGDVNSDGIEDLNVNITFHILTGTFRWYDNVWFSRKTADGVLEKIEI